MGTITTDATPEVTLRRAIYVANDYSHVFQTHGAYSVRVDEHSLTVQGRAEDGAERIASILQLRRKTDLDHSSDKHTFESWTGIVDGVYFQLIVTREVSA